MEIVKELLKKDDIDVNKGTPLVVAACGGHLQIVKELLKKKEIDVNKRKDKTLADPLYCAALGGHLEIVKELLENPEIEMNQVYEQHSDEWFSKKKWLKTPLDVAIDKGHSCIVVELLNKGAHAIANYKIIELFPLLLENKISVSKWISKNYQRQKHHLEVKKAKSGDAKIGGIWDATYDLIYDVYRNQGLEKKESDEKADEFADGIVEAYQSE